MKVQPIAWQNHAGGQTAGKRRVCLPQCPSPGAYHPTLAVFMGYLLQGLFGERSLPKVVGLFSPKSQAESSMTQVLRAEGLQAGQVRLLGPHDAKAPHREWLSQALEPETQGMARTFFQTHVVGAMAGAAAGLGLFAWLYRAGHPMIVSSQMLAFVALVGFGTTFGLLSGGLLSMWPDHIRLIARVRSALRHEHWGVVTQPITPEQTARVKAVLHDSAAEVVSTLWGPAGSRW